MWHYQDGWFIEWSKKADCMLTIFGSVVLDTIHTPNSTYTDGLGGAAIYAAMAAGCFTTPNMVGRSGGDLTDEHMNLLKGVTDTKGLSGADGRTFRYEARYTDNFQAREDIRVEPNVPEGYIPHVPEQYRRSDLVYLANENPTEQLHALEQFDSPAFVMCDTISHWIHNKREDVIRVLGASNAVIINDVEARELTGKYNLVQCARDISDLGAAHIIIKKSEHGSILFSGGGIFPLPAYPVEQVVDPTGAGDAFAGAMMGYLESVRSIDMVSLRRACVYGNVMGSLTVEQEGVTGLAMTDAATVEQRAQKYHSMICAEP